MAARAQLVKAYRTMDWAVKDIVFSADISFRKLIPIAKVSAPQEERERERHALKYKFNRS